MRPWPLALSHSALMTQYQDLGSLVKKRHPPPDLSA
jgi:hypothetical protein